MTPEQVWLYVCAPIFLVLLLVYGAALVWSFRESDRATREWFAGAAKSLDGAAAAASADRDYRLVSGRMGAAK